MRHLLIAAIALFAATSSAQALSFAPDPVCNTSEVISLSDECVVLRKCGHIQQRLRDLVTRQWTLQNRRLGHVVNPRPSSQQFIRRIDERLVHLAGRVEIVSNRYDSCAVRALR